MLKVSKCIIINRFVLIFLFIVGFVFISCNQESTQVNGYIVEFSGNAETVSGFTKSLDAPYDKNVTLTENGFTRTGYTFSKWNTKADGSGTDYQDKATVKNLTTEKNITLYAQWTPNTYIIRFSGNDETVTGTMEPMNATYDSDVILIQNAFNKTGYVFNGWYLDPNGVGTKYANKAKVKNITTGGEVTLYAQWIQDAYTIEFDANANSEEVSGTTESMTVSYGQDVVLTLNGFSRTGYTFSKWNIEANGKGTSYTNGQTVSNLVSSGTITLYAQWTANTYTIQFDSNGGTGTTKSVTATYDVNVTLTANGFSRTGYTFSNWNTKADGKGTSYTNGQTVSNLVSSGTITLYAQWTANTYTIQFDSNGGTGTTESVTATYGVNATLTANGFSRTGYTFSKWNTKADGKGTSYTNGQTVSNLVSSGTITLYAQWTANTYTIQFDANGGTGTTESVTATYGVNATLTANGFSRTGYTFSNWNTEADGKGTSYTNGQTVSNLVSSGTITLYAQWTANTYTIQFNSNGGTGATEFVTATYGVNATLTANGFSKTGYTFSKWNTEADGKGTSYTNGQTVSNLVSSGTITLYAQWTANTYTIQFDANGGTGATESVTATYGVNATLTANGFTRTGYTFSKWNTEADGKGTSYTNGQTVSNLVSSGTITLYAQWTANTYTIQFDSNGGTGATESVTATYGVNATLTANGFTRTGYTFSKWNTEADGKGTSYTNGQTVSNLVSSGTITLYAQWTANTYTIQFDSNGGTGTTKSVTATYGVNATLTANGFSRTGYTFSKWNTKADGKGTSYTNGQTVSNLVTSGTITLYAQWTANTYTIQFDANGGEGTTKSVTATYDVNAILTANGFSRTGYTFSNWNTKADGKGTSYTNGQTVSNLVSSGTITLYAQWTANTYTIQFDANGGTGATESVTATYGVNATLTANGFTRTGYTFSKWNTEADGKGTSYTNGQTVSNLVSSGPITLYAQWTANTYTIQFDSNGGTGATESVTATYGVNATLTANGFTRTGYTFSKWNTKADGKGTSYTNGQTVSNLVTSGTITLYAQWTANTYTIQFDSNGGTGTTKSVTATYGVNVTLTANGFSRTGYTFSKWNTKADGSGTDYQDKATVKNLTTEGDVTLYAQWTLIDYTITYELNGGTASNPASYNIESETFDLSNPERSGYIFSGWTWEGQNTPSKTVTISKGSTGNKVYIANWIIDSAESEIKSGIFSVGAGKKVKFSSGNLQAVYNSEGSADTWRFAPTQLDFAGEQNNTISDPTEGTIIDLFGWSTTTDSLYGISYEADYSGKFRDWGSVIDSDYDWFTLSKDEWAYLIGEERTVNGGTGEGNSYRRAEVDSVYGLILYPDTYNKQTGATSYNAEQWAEMENDGCIFLPSAGNRWFDTFVNMGSDEFLISDYWTSTPCGEGEAYNFTFNINDDGNVYHSDRYAGYSVRLVTLVTE